MKQQPLGATRSPFQSFTARWHCVTSKPALHRQTVPKTDNEYDSPQIADSRRASELILDQTSSYAFITLNLGSLSQDL